MKIEVKITDKDGNINQYVIGGYSLSDEEIEEYAKGVYGEEGEIWKRITKSFIVGAKWARDVLNARQCGNLINQETTNDTKPVCGEVSFSVNTYSLLDKNVKYCHWSEGLNMIIEQNGTTIKLNSEEIQQVVKSLPRTVGGSY